MAKKVMYQGKEVEVVDVTPKWVAAANIYIMALENGNAEGRKAGIGGIMQMAKMLDVINEKQLLKEGSAEHLSKIK